jgi:hypothetical protein
MWISGDRFWTMVEALALANERARAIEQKVASMQATQDWLTNHVNRLEHERRILTEARLGLSFPQPIIERSDPNADAEETMRGGVVHGIPDDSLPLAQLMSASMEDVGDAAAAALGIETDAQGNISYKR